MPMGTPLVFAPAAGRPHLATIVVLHCFTWSGREMAVYRLPRLRAAMPSSVFNCMRVVFLSAPHRPITCFGGRITPSWHDYFTDHGGPEGQPNLEEEINVEHLAWSRSQVHAALDDELARLGVAAPGKLALLGESQGACVALDAALTYPSNNLLAGVFASYGMLYSHSRLPAESKRLPVSAFIGAGDRCIGAGLSLHSFGRMLEAGYSNVHVEVAPRLPHVYEPAAGETDLEYASIARAFDRWGLSTVSSLESKAAAHTAARAPLDTAEMAGSLSAAAISPSDEAQNAVTLSSPAGSGAAAASQPSLDGLQPVPLWQHMPEPERRPPPVPSPELLALVDEAEHRGAEEARAREEADSGEDELVCLGASP